MLLSIAYDPSVLHALQVAFPTPPDRAKQKLDKYLDLLQRELRLSLLRRTEIARKLNAYDLPLSILHNKGPTLGNRKFRVHAWLNKNGFALVTNINKNANNLTKEIALVKPTSLLVVNHANLLDDLRALTDIELTAYLDTLTIDWASVVNAYLSVYNSLSPQDQKRLYFTSPIDLDSLKNYMRKVVRGQSGLVRVSEENTIEQAEYVLRIAQVTSGFLHQRIDRKAFGRTYYEGVSVVSVSKALRMAFLGDSWEYDCKSCSTAWKMGFADDWHKLKKRRKQTVRQKFSAMTLYLEDKEAFLRQVISQVFLPSSTKDHRRILKEAMTALGFGAKLGLGMWKGKNGEERQTSLFEVFEEDIDDLTRFVQCGLVKKFNEEQQILNKYIVLKFSVDPQWHKDMAIEMQRKKMKVPFSQAQKVVWLFQHAESRMMDIVRGQLSAMNRTVLANVHDAIVIRDGLSPLELQHIEQTVKTATKIDYFALGETEYERVT